VAALEGAAEEAVNPILPPRTMLRPWPSVEPGLGIADGPKQTAGGDRRFSRATSAQEDLGAELTRDE